MTRGITGCVYEVAPVVCTNLLSVAGIWTGFDESWLFERTGKRAEHPSLGLRLAVFIGLGRWLMTYATHAHWDRIIERVAAAHAADRT